MPHRSMEEIMADYNEKRRKTQVFVDEQDRKYEARVTEEYAVVEDDERERHPGLGNRVRHISPETSKKS